MASSSNFSKDEDVAQVLCRQDPSEVGTLPGRASPLSRPYPSHYRAAFFFRHRLPPIPSPSLAVGLPPVVGDVGLTQLPIKKDVVGVVGAYAPVGVIRCRRPTGAWGSPTHLPFWYRL